MNKFLEAVEMNIVGEKKRFGKYKETAKTGQEPCKFKSDS